MYLKKSFITDAKGNFLFTAIEESTSLAKAVHEKKSRDNGWSEGRTRKLLVSVPPYVFQHYSDLYGPECWQSKDFLRYFKAARPEFCI